MSESKYVAMDVHKSITVICVMDKNGKVIGIHRVRTESEAIRSFIKGIKGGIHLTFEEGTHAAWLYDLLTPYVEQLLVCDPRRNRERLAGNKNDDRDAQMLAEMLRTNSLKAVYHGAKSTRALKELGRSYQAVVIDSTRVMNRIKAIYRGRAICCDGESVYHPRKRAEWLKKLSEPGARKRAEIFYSELDHLRKLHKTSKAALLEEARKHKAVKLLMKIPGLGPIRTAQIVAIVANPYRFNNRRQFWTYCGLSVVMRTSADYQIVAGTIKKRSLRSGCRGLNWNHNRELKMIFKGAANTAVQREPFESFHQKLLDRKLAPELAKVTVARKLSAIVLHLWKKGEAFDPKELSKSKKQGA